VIGHISDVLNKRGVAHRAGVLTATLCTFRIGGVAAALIEPVCIQELIRAVDVCRAEGLPYVVIGRGSNILFDDGVIDLVLIRTTQLSGIRQISENEVRVLGGTALTAACYSVAKKGLSGLEFAWGIPGTVGGAVFMNAGAGGRSMEDVVATADIYDVEKRKIRTLINLELGFSYRFSNIQRNKAILLSANLHIQERKEPQVILAKMYEFAKHRRLTQPLDLPSAGSAFKRHCAQKPLSRELDRLGLKGLAVGGACVSEKHAGFIVNRGGATASDVRRLISIIQDTVKKDMGFEPKPELRFIPEET
jgi:UDP-N-acetylmuramate dehydrogenase